MDEAVASGGTGDATINADNPWPGLLSFRETDEGYFQGRQTETEDLLRLALRERLTILFGPSGLGKSSLLQAGLFPKLRRKDVFPVYIRLDFSSKLPDLAAQFSAIVARDACAHRIEAPSSKDGETLWEYFHGEGNNFWNARNRPVTPLLVFDQFEEMFTLGRLDLERSAAAEAFLDQLADLVECRPPAKLKAWIDEHPEEASAFNFGRHHYKILLGIREDFLPDLEALRTRMPAVALNRMRLQRMNGEAALLVVNQAKHLIDPDVAEQVVRFVAADKRNLRLAELEIEPALLSVVCRELNNRRQKLGEAKISAGLLQGNQEQVLADFYERSTKDLPPEVRSFVEDHLLTVSGYRDSVALENALSSPGVSGQAIDTLVERRLVRREDRGGTQRLELTHDLLAGVIRASRDSRRQREAAQKERDALLQTQEEHERELLKAKERLELERAQERERMVIAKRKLQRTRIAGAAFFVLALIAAGTAVWAHWAQQQAANQAAANRVWKARLLAALANESLSEDPELSILLGMHAVNSTFQFGQPPVPAAEQALYQAILFSRVQVTLHGHAEAVNSVAWSQDEKRLATASDDHTVKVWDAASGQELLSLKGHTANVNSVAWSPDDKRLATASDDHTAKVWDAASGQELLTFKGHKEHVNDVAWSPDGKRLATASNDHMAKVWDAANGRELLTLVGHGDHVNSVAWGPDGKRLATGSSDHGVVLWDVTSGRSLLVLQGHKHSVNSVAWSPDGKRLTTASGDQTAMVWDAKSGRALLTLKGHTAEVNSVAWSRDGKRLATASNDRMVAVWDAASGLELLRLQGHKHGVNGVAWSSDGKRLATASTDHTAKVWDAASGQALLTLQGHANTVRSVAWSPDGERLATGSWDQTAKVWDATSGQALLTLKGDTSYVNSVAWRPDGKWLATGSGDDTAKVRDAASGRELLTLNARISGVVSVAWSPDGKRLAVGGGDEHSGTAKVWDIASLQTLLTLRGHTSFLYSVAWSPDGKKLATASDDKIKMAMVWDAASGQELLALEGHNDRVFSIAWSPDGKRLATGSGDETARVWDAMSGQDLLTLKGHKAPVISVAWSPDGGRLATGSGDHTVKVWDAENGQELLALKGHSAEVYSVAWSPDGKRLATGSVDHTAKVWDAVSGQFREMDPRLLLNLARARVTRDLTPDECKRYFQNEKCPQLRQF